MKKKAQQIGFWRGVLGVREKPKKADINDQKCRFPPQKCLFRDGRRHPALRNLIRLLLLTPTVTAKLWKIRRSTSRESKTAATPYTPPKQPLSFHKK